MEKSTTYVKNKVGIAACYYQHNYGSMLQAYATQLVLDKLGYDNEVINIDGFSKEIKKSKLKYFVLASLTSDLFFVKLGMLKNAIVKRYFNNEYATLAKLRSAKFDEFSKTHFKLSPKYKSIKELSKECEKMYTDVIVGSDQLWLPANIAADFFTLSFVPSCINTIAYATSFGQSTLPRIICSKAKSFLDKIRYIGVREESGRTLIKRLTGRDVEVVCDPTLLISSDEWISIINPECGIKENYILCYFLGNNPWHREYAKKLKEKTGYKIVALVHLDEIVKCDFDYADETPYDIDPLDFLNLIYNAKYVCTDSFHCSVFSMLFKKDFYTFKRYSDKTKLSTNSRITNLLEQVGLTERLIATDYLIEDCLEKSINYDQVDKKIEELRNKSYDFLINALNQDGK